MSCWECDYMSMLGLKLVSVDKKGWRKPHENFLLHIQQKPVMHNVNVELIHDSNMGL